MQTAHVLKAHTHLLLHRIDDDSFGLEHEVRKRDKAQSKRRVANGLCFQSHDIALARIAIRHDEARVALRFIVFAGRLSHGPYLLIAQNLVKNCLQRCVVAVCEARRKLGFPPPTVTESDPSMDHGASIQVALNLRISFGCINGHVEPFIQLLDHLALGDAER